MVNAIVQREDAQARGEVRQFGLTSPHLVMQPRHEAPDAPPFDMRHLVEDRPEDVFKPHRGRIAVNSNLAAEQRIAAWIGELEQAAQASSMSPHVVGSRTLSNISC